MDVETCNLAQHVFAGHIDGQGRRRTLKQFRYSSKPVFGDQDGFSFKARCVQKHGNDDFAFGDKSTLTAYHVPFTDVSIGAEAGIRRIVNCDEHRALYSDVLDLPTCCLSMPRCA